MNYGSKSIDYALRNGLVDVVDHDDVYTETVPLKYARKRSANCQRRSTKRRSSAAHPGFGINGRRNRHYSW